jgi:hypothetical protein
MMAKYDEVRDLVKRLIALRLAEKVGVQNVTFGGEDVEVTKAEDGSMKFNLSRLKRSFVLLSGRLYEREFTGNNARTVKEIDQSSPIIEQHNYHGVMEKVDIQIFNNKLVCACGNVRWIKRADCFQVTKCKPCTLRERKERRKTRRLSAH